ncbi:metal ABC transporter permease [Collinsella vaginalis]|uniref:metal ABC transporter permease n=1 Tax=Collinsella vaginalis TaxID=1870987 RepID=UPI0031836EB4
MPEIFAYAFMQRALIAGLVIGVAVPLVGVTVVLKRLSMIGDALGHASLAGVAAGLIAGLNPVAGAVVACVSSAFCIEGIRRVMPARADLAVAVIMAAGIGLAGVLSGFVPNSATFSSFLFGSIVTVGDAELVTVIGVGAAVILFCTLLSRELFWVALDERAARLAGVRTGFVNAAFVLVCALTISIASRTVGSLIVSSMMTVPVASAIAVSRSWRQCVFVACLVGAVSSLAGLVLSFYVGLRPGGAIVLVEVGILISLLLVRGAVSRLRRRADAEAAVR